MKTKQLFAGLTPEKERRYADEAARRWDAKTVRASQRKWARYTPAEKAAILAEGNAIYRDLLVVMPLGPTAAPVQACIVRWRRHIGHFWVPNDEQCLALATGYRDDPAFRKNYDAMDPRLAPFMCDAVEFYVAARGKTGAAAQPEAPMRGAGAPSAGNGPRGAAQRRNPRTRP